MLDFPNDIEMYAWFKTLPHILITTALDKTELKYALNPDNTVDIILTSKTWFIANLIADLECFLFPNVEIAVKFDVTLPEFGNYLEFRINNVHNFNEFKSIIGLLAITS